MPDRTQTTDTEILSKTYLELASVLSLETVSYRELHLLSALKRCLSCVEASQEYRIGNPAFEQAEAQAKGILKNYGRHGAM